jgi:hypothetical protein
MDRVMERRYVLRQVLDIDTDIFLTSLEKSAKLLLQQKERLEKEGWKNLHLKMDHYPELIVMGLRQENDEEYSKRIAAEDKRILAAKRREERERQKYEELKTKYEK